MRVAEGSGELWSGMQVEPGWGWGKGQEVGETAGAWVVMVREVGGRCTTAGKRGDRYLISLTPRP